MRLIVHETLPRSSKGRGGGEKGMGLYQADPTLLLFNVM